ncbi:ttn-1 [Symbiodinium necroappetens]|uniref:Ttn-1 protein n=1 Tax=Symbiodinium necroappetens TaxID=1628268 RepID=A0A812YFH8_9DINO|nr:ttn-1 [Symbiodinium necroappetens]
MALRALSTLLLVGMPLAKGLTFSHSQGGDTATWELHMHDGELHVKADCPANRWCSLGFNKDKPKMDGTDVFTFGHHPGVDLSDCHQTCGCGSTACGCGSSCGTSCGCGCGCGASSATCGRKLRSRNTASPTPSPFLPYERELKVWLPAPPTLRAVGAPQSPKALGGVVGIALNSVLFVHEHPGEGMTWVIDNCGGHGDTFGHYHYHAPPICLLRSLGVPVPKQGAWWKSGGAEHWASHGPEVQIGWALDGAPIMAPFKAGVQVKKEMLDECHGAVDPVTGEYKYYTVLAPPFMPPCLRGEVLGEVQGYRSSKKGVPCEESQRLMEEPLASQLEPSGGRWLSGIGCPRHAIFEDVKTGSPKGWKASMAPAPAVAPVVPAAPAVPAVRAAARSHAIAVLPAELAEHAAPQLAELVEHAVPPLVVLAELAEPQHAELVEHAVPPLVERVEPLHAVLAELAVPQLVALAELAEPQPAVLAVPQPAVLAERAEPQPAVPVERAALLHVALAELAEPQPAVLVEHAAPQLVALVEHAVPPLAERAEPQPAVPVERAALLHAALAELAEPQPAVLAGPQPAVLAERPLAELVEHAALLAVMFCAMNLTVMNGATPVSISQCNLPGYSIVIDSKQDLTEVSYDISGGRMKADFHRKLNTGDCTDLVLTADTPLYIIMAMGAKDNLNVVAHGFSETHNVVCMGTMMETIECKPPSEWADQPPTLPESATSSAASIGLGLAGAKACVNLAVKAGGERMRRKLGELLAVPEPAVGGHGLEILWCGPRRCRFASFLEAPLIKGSFYAGNACAQDPSHCVMLRGGFQSLGHDFCKDSGQPDWCKKESPSEPQCLCPGRTKLYLASWQREEKNPQEAEKFDQSGSGCSASKEAAGISRAKMREHAPLPPCTWYATEPGYLQLGSVFEYRDRNSNRDGVVSNALEDDCDGRILQPYLEAVNGLNGGKGFVIHSAGLEIAQSTPYEKYDYQLAYTRYGF